MLSTLLLNVAQMAVHNLVIESESAIEVNNYDNCYMG